MNRDWQVTDTAAPGSVAVKSYQSEAHALRSAYLLNVAHGMTRYRAEPMRNETGAAVLAAGPL